MEFPALKQLEKKLEHTFDLIGKLKDQTQVKDLSHSKKERELEEYKSKEEQLRQEITRLEKEKKLGQQDYQKKQKELRKRVESMVTKLSLLERSV